MGQAVRSTCIWTLWRAVAIHCVPAQAYDQICQPHARRPPMLQLHSQTGQVRLYAGDCSKAACCRCQGSRHAACLHDSLRGAHSSMHPLSSSLCLSCLALRPEPRALLQLRRQLQGAVKHMVCRGPGCPQALCNAQTGSSNPEQFADRGASNSAGCGPRPAGMLTGPYLPALPSSLSMLFSENCHN